MDQLVLGFVNHHFKQPYHRRYPSFTSLNLIIFYPNTITPTPTLQIPFSTCPHLPTPTPPQIHPPPSHTQTNPTQTIATTRINEQPCRCQARKPMQAEGYPARHGYLTDSQCTRAALTGGLCGLHAPMEAKGKLFCGRINQPPPRPLIINNKQCYWIDEQESISNKFDPSGPKPIKRGRGRPPGTKNKKNIQLLK